MPSFEANNLSNQYLIEQKNTRPSRETDGNPGFPASDCCSMSPGAVAALLITDHSLIGAAVSIPPIRGSAGTRCAAIPPAGKNW